MTKNTTIFKEFKCNSTIVVHPKMDRPIDKKKQKENVSLTSLSSYT